MKGLSGGAGGGGTTSASRSPARPSPPLTTRAPVRYDTPFYATLVIEWLLTITIVRR
jgi:hypothetical protein